MQWVNNYMNVLISIMLFNRGYILSERIYWGDYIFHDLIDSQNNLLVSSPWLAYVYQQNDDNLNTYSAGIFFLITRYVHTTLHRYLAVLWHRSEVIYTKGIRECPIVYEYLFLRELYMNTLFMNAILTILTLAISISKINCCESIISNLFFNTTLRGAFYHTPKFGDKMYLKF
jgi:hypothetical protein